MNKVERKYWLGFLAMFAWFLILGTIGDSQWVFDPINILICAALALIFVGYFNLLLYLVDTEKWYYIILAVLISGVIPLLVLLGVRALYRAIFEKGKEIDENP